MRVCVCAPQNETLDMFQREWYRLQGEGKLSEVDMGTVPDIYLRNQQLGERGSPARTPPWPPRTPPHPPPPHPNRPAPRHAHAHCGSYRGVLLAITDPLCCCAQPTS